LLTAEAGAAAPGDEETVLNEAEPSALSVQQRKLGTCILCRKPAGDESSVLDLIIHCNQCRRPVHARCDPDQAFLCSQLLFVRQEHSTRLNEAAKDYLCKDCLWPRNATGRKRPPPPTHISLPGETASPTNTLAWHVTEKVSRIQRNRALCARKIQVQKMRAYEDPRARCAGVSLEELHPIYRALLWWAAMRCEQISRLTAAQRSRLLPTAQTGAYKAASWLRERAARFAATFKALARPAAGTGEKARSQVGFVMFYCFFFFTRLLYVWVGLACALQSSFGSFSLVWACLVSFVFSSLLFSSKKPDFQSREISVSDVCKRGSHEAQPTILSQIGYMG
jgi:hypothetical protein